MTTSMAAPSATPLAAPAWMTPSFLKIRGSFRSPSTVVSGRGCSSFSKSTLPLRVSISTGAISSRKRPAAWASAVRRWERTLNSSTSSWVIRYCSASFSAVSAMGICAWVSVSAVQSESSMAGVFPSGTPKRPPRST